MIAPSNVEGSDCRTGFTVTVKRKQSASPLRGANRLAHPVVGERDENPLVSRLESFGSDTAAATADVALAVGVLRQAARDLHTFHSAQHGIERELYLDAYNWIMDDDYSWPYSFLNVCASLEVPAGATRTELLADAPLGTCAYWKRIIARRAKSLGFSLTGAFRTPQAA